MKVICPKCSPKEEFDLPEFSDDEKVRLLEEFYQSPLQLVKYLIEQHKISHGDAKYIAMHMNKLPGTCHRCSKEISLEENQNCANCGSLNLNWRV